MEEKDYFEIPENIPQENIPQENIPHENIIKYQKTLKNIKILPLAFFYDYDKYAHLEYSNKAIAGKSLLYSLQNYTNLRFPVHFTINNNKFILAIVEYVDVDEIYIPNNIFTELLLNTEERYNITIKNGLIKKGTSVTIKPFSSDFLKLIDPKAYLETHIKRQYTLLNEKQTITLPYGNETMSFEITKTKPCKTISILDTDLETNLEEPYENVNPIEPVEPVKPPVEQVVIKEKPEPKEKKWPDSKKEFVTFSGKGHRLGD